MVGTTLDSLAMLCYSQRKFVEAEPLYQRSLAIWEKVLGPDHPMVATSLYNLAALYTIQKKYEEAEPLYMRALTIRDKGWVQGLNSLALLYVAQGKYKEAEPLYQQALASVSKTFDPERREPGPDPDKLRISSAEVGSTR